MKAKINSFGDSSLEAFVGIALSIMKRYWWKYYDLRDLRSMSLYQDFIQNLYQYYYLYKPQTLKERSSVANKALYKFFTTYKLVKVSRKNGYIIEPEGFSIREEKDEID